MKEALGLSPVTDTSEDARTVRERVAASVSTDDIPDYGQTQEDLDDFIVMASEDDIVILTEETDYAVELLPYSFSVPSVRLVNNRQMLRLTGNGSFRFNN